MIVAPAPRPALASLQLPWVRGDTEARPSTAQQPRVRLLQELCAQVLQPRPALPWYQRVAAVPGLAGAGLPWVPEPACGTRLGLCTTPASGKPVLGCALIEAIIWDIGC